MKRPHLYSWRLPDGRYIGRHSISDPWSAGSPGYTRGYTIEEIDGNREFFTNLFPDAKPVPTPRWNPESGEYETPIDTPSIG